MPTFSRRTLLGLAIASTTPGLARAIDAEEFNPSDRIPRRFSVRRFLSLSKDEIYDVNLAVRRGRGILIDGFTRSESRALIELALKDPAAARAQLSP